MAFLMAMKTTLTASPVNETSDKLICQFLGDNRQGRNCHVVQLCSAGNTRSYRSCMPQTQIQDKLKLTRTESGVTLHPFQTAPRAQS